MGLITTAAFSTIINSLLSTKGGKEAKDEFSSAVWNWIKPLLIKEDEQLVKDLEEKPDDEKLQKKLQLKLEYKVLDDENFKSALEQKIIEATQRNGGNHYGDVYTQESHGDGAINNMTIGK